MERWLLDEEKASRKTGCATESNKSKKLKSRQLQDKAQLRSVSSTFSGCYKLQDCISLEGILSE
jgi:hypothetical protein